MNRTYVDITGEYYDNLDGIIDWGNEIDLYFYDPKNVFQRDPTQI